MPGNNVLSADNQQGRLVQGQISDQFLAGFTDGEGCFYIGMSKRDDLPLKWQIILEFRLSQNPGGKNILEFFQNRLECGYVKPNHATDPQDKSWVLVVRNKQDLENKVIPFFNANNLFSAKMDDFKCFKKVLNFMKNGRHLSKEGFREIIELIYNCPNASRKRYSKALILSED